MADDECRREIYLDPLEAWQSFREALRIRLMMSIEAARHSSAAG